MLQQAREALPPNGLDGAITFEISTQGGKPTLLVLTRADQVLPTSNDSVFQALLNIEFLLHIPTKDELTEWLKEHPKILGCIGTNIALLAVEKYLASEHTDSAAPPKLCVFDAHEPNWHEYPSTTHANNLLILLEKRFPEHDILLPLAQFVPRSTCVVSATEAYKGHK
jgi:hypothetical protein